MMLLYVTVGSNDIPRARIFYDAVMPTLGHVLRQGDATELCYGPPGDTGPCLWIDTPYDGNAATVGNGSMLALAAPSRAAVAAFHAAGLAHGGTDEGAPGLRKYGPDFYACYLRDPDGNKLSAVCEAPE
jgi:catechol 2,3-dioxygenase-like lactoylglutathione lyase family enzyme